MFYSLAVPFTVRWRCIGGDVRFMYTVYAPCHCLRITLNKTFIQLKSFIHPFIHYEPSRTFPYSTHGLTQWKDNNRNAILNTQTNEMEM